MNIRYAEKINNLIAGKDIDGLEKYLQELNETETFDTDLFYTFYILNIIKAEKESGEATLMDYYSDISDILCALKELRRMVRRFEWCDEFDKSEILLYMSKNHLSAYVLYWVIETCCVDGDRVWGCIRNE